MSWQKPKPHTVMRPTRHRPPSTSIRFMTRVPVRAMPEALSDVDRWLAMLRQALSANYDRLDALLAGMDSTGKDKK